MINKKQKLLAKLFNNPIGRKYLNVPKGKKIYKITKASAHFYTGNVINGARIISTGVCKSNGRLKFIKWLENWKPIHLCWLFRRLGKKIPKYLIGDDTGENYPAACDGTWSNCERAYGLDDASISSQNAYMRFWNFSFGISEQYIYGIYVRLNCKAPSSESADLSIKLSWDDGSSWASKFILFHG